MNRVLGFAGKVGMLLALSAAVACGGSVSPAADTPDGSAVSDGAPGHDSAAEDTAVSGEDAGKDSAVADTGVDSDTGSDSGVADTGTTGDAEVPLYHRPDDSQCMAPAPAGQCSSGGQGPGTGMCTEDSQCTTGTNGRCNNDGPLPGCSCTYDSCASDTDCQSGQLCACHGAGYSQGAGNTCVPGNCRVDSDCGAHGYCSPSTSSSACGGVTGYYCHTAPDTCVNDTDCTNSGLDACEWSTTDGRWECTMEGLCG